MSENEFEKRMAAFDEERDAIYARPILGLSPVQAVLYLGALFSLLTAAATGFVEDESALRALIIVAVMAMVATALTSMFNWLAYRGEEKRRTARLADVDERRRQFLREQ